MSLWDGPFTIRSGQVNSRLSSRRRVYKMRGELFHAGPALKPWMVTGHPVGAKSFRTWDEAMAYATARMYIWNASHPPGYDERHETNAWRAKHGLEAV